MAGPRTFITPHWISGGIAFVVMLAIYLSTLAPTVTLEYSGQLIVAADHLGVARPPGYPVWTLLAKGFICLFPFATYQGHPNPAWAVHVMSALFGALTCGLLAGLVSSESRFLCPAVPKIHRRAPEWTGAIAGVGAALLFGLSPVQWSQSVIAETHTLTNFTVLLFLSLSLRWIHTGEHRMAALLAFLYGLSLSVSPLLILLAPVLLLAAAFHSRKTALTMGSALGLFLGFIAAEYAWGQATPSRSALLLCVLVGLGLLLAAFRSTRPVAILLGLMLIGLLPYLYLPLAAAHNPPMNMGQACNWNGFWYVLNRGQYEAFFFINPFIETGKFVRQLGWMCRMGITQFPFPLAALALVPVVSLPGLNRRARKGMALVLLASLLFSVGVLIGMNPQLDIQTTFIARVTFIPFFALIALLGGLGLILVIRVFTRRKR